MEDDRPDRGLAGLVIGVPAARRATETARLIERWGGTPLVGPTVEEVPVEDEAPVIRATGDLIAAPARWVVHMTGVGTRRWFDIALRAGLHEPLLQVLGAARLIPRGAKANDVLKSNKLKAEWIPSTETSREITEWLAPQIRPGDTVGLQRHGEAVPGLSGTLAGAGATVIELATYRWEIPQDRAPAQALVKALAGGTCGALVITSAPQVRNLFRVAESMGYREELLEALRRRVYLAAVGVVAASALKELDLAPDLVARPARLGALIRGLAGARQEILGKDCGR